MPKAAAATLTWSGNGPTLTPIRFVAIGELRVAQNLTHRLMEDGFFPNIVGFPAVPLKKAGIRITITRHQSEDDIRSLVDALAYHLPLALKEEGKFPAAGRPSAPWFALLFSEHE